MLISRQLRKENMQAMKEKDTLKKGVLSLVISAIALAEKEKGETLSEADELVYVAGGRYYSRLRIGPRQAEA